MLRFRIREVAEQRGMNRSKLQMQAQVTRGLLDRYWKNESTEIRIPDLDRIAKALGVRSMDLLEEAADESEARAA